MFGESHAYIRVHDNLDSDVVYNTVIGIYFADPTRAQHILLGGNMPIYLLQRITWPLSLFWLLKSRFLAYLLNDLIVRAVGMAGMFYLAKRIGSTLPAAILAGVLFSLSLSFPIYGLTVAAIPAVLYLAQQESEGHGSLGKYAMLFLFGWNSALVLGGMFLLVALPLLRRVLFGNAKGGLRSWSAYAAGLAAGSAGLLYATASGLHLHREAYNLSGLGLYAAAKHFATNQLCPFYWDFYQVSSPLTILYAALGLALLRTRSRKIAAGIGVILLINLWYSALTSDFGMRLLQQFGGFARSANLSRFYFLVSALVIAVWVIAVRDASPRLRRILMVTGIVQVIWVIVFSTQVFYPVSYALTQHPITTLHYKGKVVSYEAIMGALGMPPIPTFDEHFSWQDYEAIKLVIADSTTISVGLDPMVAVMNGISTLDGYYNVYPLAYKAKFRHIIAAQLKVAGKEEYFDGWGNRIYTFADNPENLSLDYCAARDLGAGFVISRFDIASPNLEQVTMARQRLRLYSIVGCSGESSRDRPAFH